MDNLLQDIDTLTVKFALAAVLLPLLAFLINIVLPGKRNKMAGWVSTLAILAGGVLSVFVFARVWNDHQVHQSQVWFTIGDTKVYGGILLNNLSVLMLLLVNLIALPVHIYSIAYMKEDEGFKRYFAYLSFFCFSMLALVVADNLVLFYVLWELVGFSSYLLIGFWFTRDKAAYASKKAFVMNRIGDMGLLIAIIILYTQFGTVDIDQLFGSKNLAGISQPFDGLWVPGINLSHLPNNVGSVWINYAKGAPLMLGAIWQYIAVGGIFLAVAAKSAQFPLHTWLPDAMEGPTSISALIHAATMVAAGVFLLGRVYPLFNSTELTILAIIGCFTAFMAASIALAQNDLKRILAYSTISQLGYMVMAMGVGAYASSFFHLVTHAFFKCLLFLVAGIVIHEMAHIRDENKLDFDPQDISNMGGLRKKLPFTFIVAVIGGLALVGLPFTSGFLSKDGILIRAFEWADDKSGVFKIVPIAALITTWLTAFYVTRLIVKVFFGELRIAKISTQIKLHITDGGWLYKLPLLLLAICCAFPLFSINPFFFQQSWLYGGLSSATRTAGIEIYHNLVPAGVNIVSLLIIWFAYSIYSKKLTNPFPQKGLFYNLSAGEWYFDKIYAQLIIKPVIVLSRAAFWNDRRVIDGFINLLARVSIGLSRLSAWIDHYIIDGFIRVLIVIVRATSNFARRFQGGKVQYYIYSMLVVILALFILKIVF